MYIACMNKLIAVIVLLLLSLTNSVGQTNVQAININDSKGKPDGVWYTYTPAQMGEPAMAVLGSYDHGDKTGTWYTSDGQGNMLSIEQYKYNVKDGEMKYFENGQLSCVGHYRGLNPSYKVDTVLITHPITGEEKYFYVPTERGSVRHGMWRFYDPLSGRLIREEEYQIDDLIYSKDFSISAADSIYYQKRNAQLPHAKKTTAGPKPLKIPVKSLIN
jgi:antitoxin component YwqK of YwqJK toxin-antitoxin module